jgi:hypothetical protein
VSARRDEAVRHALGQLAIPDAAAAEQRARAVVLDAYAAHEPVAARGRRTGLRLALGVAGAALLAGVAVASPGGETIRRIVRDAVRANVLTVRSAPLAAFRLPEGGSLLVRSKGALFLVHADGSRLVLGPYRDAAWSPHARFVVATAGRHLVVLDPRSGATRWSITAATAVHGARWSLEPSVPPCCRVAYLADDPGRGKGLLHVIAGDGSGDRVLGPADAQVAPAWQPASRRRALAYVDAAGSLRVISADSGRLLAGPIWRGFRPTRLAWSADGTRLLAMNRRRLLILDEGLRSVVRILAPTRSGRLVSGSFIGRGHAVVVLRRLAGGRSRVELLPAKGPGRPLATLVGTLSGMSPSPDGRSVLVGWGAADQWLLVPVGHGPTRRLTGLARRFGTAPAPIVDAWHTPRS